MKDKQKKRRLYGIAFFITMCLSFACVGLLTTLLKTNSSAKELTFSEATITGISESYDGNGYFVMTADNYLHEVKGGEVTRSTLVEKQADDGGELMSVIQFNDSRLLVCSRSYVYLMDLVGDNTKEWKLKSSTPLYYYAGPSCYDYHVDEEGNIDVYFALTNTSQINVNMELLRIEGDNLITGNVYGEILKTSGQKSLTNMKSRLMNMSLTTDGKELLLAYESGLIMKVDVSDQEALHTFLNYETGRDDREAYNSYGVEVLNTKDTIKAAASNKGNGQLYITLQNAREIALVDEKMDKATIANSNLVLDIMYYSANENSLYLQSSEKDVLQVLDVETGKFDYKANTVFNLTSMLTSPETDEYIVYWFSATSNEQYVSVYNLEELSNYRVASILRICVTILAVILGLLAVLFGCIYWMGEKVSKKLKSILQEIWKGRWVYLILFPSFALLVVFSLYPSILTVKNAFFQHMDGKPYIFVGLYNFKVIFQSSYWGEMIRNTVLFMACDIFTGIVPPVFFAYVIRLMRNKKTVQWVRLFMYVPAVLSGISSLLVWKYGIYGSNGLLNQIITANGGETISFLGTSETAIWSILLIGFPWIGGFLLFYGAFMGIPDEIYDATELEGVPLTKRFFKIELPFIMGQIRYVLIGQVIAAVQTVGRVWGTTQGAYGTMTPMFKVYDFLYNQSDYGKASAVAVLMLIVLSGITYMRMNKMLKGDQSYG